MEKEVFYQLMKERVKTAEKIGSNCVGTAPYLSGEIDCDRALSREEAKKLYSGLSTKLIPDLGNIVVWGVDANPIHAGVIFQENPYKVLHRNGNVQNGGGRLTLTNLDELNEKFNGVGISTRYKIPRKLELVEN